MGKFYITTAIDYVNNRPHLGTAYEKIGADCIARYRRLKGDEVFFLMGADEHSQNVADRAREQGTEPQVFCDGMAAQFEEVWRTLDISYDGFIRTTAPRHVATVQELLGRIHAAGDIYQGLYTGHYCVSCESFLQPGDLVEGQCPTHQREAQWLEEENYFFRLSRYADALKELLAKKPSFVEPATRRNEVLGILEGGLQDVCISRKGVTWGIPLPWDPEVRTYVWFDALINYVSGVGYSDDRDAFERWWPADCHVIGKDIIRFHCVIWPAMLLSAGLPLPEQVFAHGFVYFKGEKFSKSRGVIVDPLEAAELHGADALRYFLLREISWGQDGDFTWERFADRFNADLANDLGNLVNRVRTLIAKHGGSVVRPAETEPVDRELAEKAEQVKRRYVELADRQEFHVALAAVWELVGAANTYVERTAPWKLVQPRLGAVLYQLAEAVRWIAVLVWPALPGKADEIFAGLGLAGGAAGGGLDALARWGGPAVFSGVERGQPLFPRIDKQQFEQRKEEAPVTEQITIDDFFKVDLRVGKVVAAEKVEKADKLLQLQVEVGGELRQLVAGIAMQYAPEELVGQSIVVVANLQPAKIRGIESRGMLLAASGPDGTISILQPLREVASGSQVR